MKTICLPLSSLIADPMQPRQTIPDVELDQLAVSISGRGLLQPLRVKQANAEGKHVITIGHRRHAALVKLGATEAPCIIGDSLLDEASILAEQLTENTVRANLSVMEEAKGYRRFLDLRGCSSKEAAQELGIAPGRLSKLIPLVNLPPELQSKVHDGTLAADTAYNLARLPDSEDRTFLYEQALSGRLNRDQAAARAKSILMSKKSTETPKVSLRRVSCLLENGRTLTLSGREVELDGLIDSLEVVLKEARKARTQGLDVTTLARVFRDKAAKGGAV